MSYSSITDSDQDYVFLTTFVTVGKSFSSRGWALSRNDIQDWIPVEKFERDCKVIINDICSDAILRFNPRLFYESNELSVYLKELYDKGHSRDKIPMDIKINKANLFLNISSIEKYLNLEFIETQLSVGKSYKSKGWQLSKEVVSVLFPIHKYDEEYAIFINDIESNAKLNFQFRLFYKENKLSEYLEGLFYENPRQKVPAKIIFEVNSDYPEVSQNEVKEILKKEDISVDVNQHNSCIICGEDYGSINMDFKGYDGFSNICPVCLNKIIALDNFNLIKDNSFSNFVKKEHVEEIIFDNFEKIWELLLEYNFLTPFGDLYKLKSNELIEKNYSKYLSDESKVSISSKKKRNHQKILELIKEEDIEETPAMTNVCNVCGVVLDNLEIDKCELCMDKSLATEYLHDFVTEIPYGNHFSKLDLVDIGIESLRADLIINKLVEYNLIVPESDIFYRLNEVSYLNNFIEKYSDNLYQLQINYINKKDVLKISKEDFSSEEKLDSLIKWKKFGDFISFKKGQYGFVSVQFKQDGMFLYSKGYTTSYEAKVAAAYYLESLGKISFITEDEIKLEFK